jgi:lipid-A-disaccharide synthase
MSEPPRTSNGVRRIFILAGEASGDAYGGALVAALLDAQPGLEIRCWGGESMEKAGATCSRHYRTLAFMGVWEVLKNARTIRERLRECWNEIQQFQPDVFVGIDYPGFNLRMARKAHEAGIITHHYISPSVWAWKKNRIHSIRRDIDCMHVILPFEKQWYAQENMEVQWVGHPLLELLPSEEQPISSSKHGERPQLLLLPGSRKQELDSMLRVMLAAAKALPQFDPVIAGAPGRTDADYAAATAVGVPVRFGQTRTLMASCDVALVTSGTATLEAALMGLPHVICYKTSWLTYAAARLLVKSKWIGLPNLLLRRSVVPERIQSDCTALALVADVNALHDGRKLAPAAQLQLDGFAELARSLKAHRPASELVSAAILQGT